MKRRSGKAVARGTFACHYCPFTSPDAEVTFQHMTGNECPGRSERGDPMDFGPGYAPMSNEEWENSADSQR